MNDFVGHIEEWTSRRLDWDEDELVRVASRDACEIIEWVAHIHRRMQEEKLAWRGCPRVA
jgi:hypothetical protein